MTKSDLKLKAEKGKSWSQVKCDEVNKEEKFSGKVCVTMLYVCVGGREGDTAVTSVRSDAGAAEIDLSDTVKCRAFPS